MDRTNVVILHEQQPPPPPSSSSSSSSSSFTSIPRQMITHQKSRGYETLKKTISTPLSAFICLQLNAENSISISLDNLTVHSYLVAALTQFLGLTGAAISFDILKVERDVCWIRVPREDMSAVLAAVSSWNGTSSDPGKLGWIVKAKGNWLSCLIPQQETGIWND
ncbi:hypothetical protein OnM2_060010 [Erysiphe neolycopersici]|uniref:Ribonucleases P/MRP subunit Pop8-like domain-containing protein n=1 Tax=Erysiphe neolycopersici TaxID=212602 RepID=A0A420HPL4_9PEZI|nr:hypothetical protein OnM2_060010 [Erysiphe neolycopersici]